MAGLDLRIRCGSDSWPLNDLSGHEVEDLEQLMGAPLTRWDLDSTKLKLALMATFLRRSKAEEEIGAVIDGLKLPEILDCWETGEDDLPTEFVDGVPLGEPATTTTTIGSSSSGDATTGLPTLPDANPSET